MKRETGHQDAGSRRRIRADARHRSMRRKLLLALGAAALASPLTPRAQTKVWRIGYLDSGSRQSLVDSGRQAALIEGLRERGYVEGKNFVLEARFADGHADRLDALAGELMRQRVDLVLSTGTPASHAAQRAMATIPIVVIVTDDPVGEGFAANLARPGGNITGMSSGNADTDQKLVELLLVAAPKLKRIAVITNPATSVHAPRLLSIQTAAKQTGKQVLPVSARTPEEIERGFTAMVRERPDAVIILADVFLLQQRSQLARLALKHRLPSIYPQQYYAEAGGLMSYGADVTDNFRRAGIFVDKILKGAKPGDIPFEQPTRYYLVINRKTANALGINILRRIAGPRRQGDRMNGIAQMPKPGARSTRRLCLRPELARRNDGHVLDLAQPEQGLVAGHKNLRGGAERARHDPFIGGIVDAKRNWFRGCRRERESAQYSERLIAGIPGHAQLGGEDSADFIRAPVRRSTS